MGLPSSVGPVLLSEQSDCSVTWKDACSMNPALQRSRLLCCSILAPFLSFSLSFFLFLFYSHSLSHSLSLSFCFSRIFNTVLGFAGGSKSLNHGIVHLDGISWDHPVQSHRSSSCQDVFWDFDYFQWWCLHKFLGLPTPVGPSSLPSHTFLAFLSGSFKRWCQRVLKLI